MRSSTLSLITIMLCLCCALSHGQSIPSPAAAGPQPDIPEPQQLWNGSLGDEVVASGDLVYIAVTGSPELSRSYRVTGEGQLVIPLLHQPVQVAGLAPAAIGHAIADELMREKLLVNPIISVSVLEYRSRRVSIVGAVKNPTIIQAVGDIRLLDAIARAQGFSAEAGPEVIVSRPGETPGARSTIQIPIKELLAGKSSELNVALHGGEEIRVPEAPRLFIVGNVKQPGSYPLNELGGSSVLKALAISQGTLSFTSKQAYVYRLQSGSQERKEITVDLREILHRKSPDFPLQANDILYIPENARAHLNANILDRIAGFGGNVGSGLLIWH
jgi:polysaccharide export outer membrane protein